MTLDVKVHVPAGHILEPKKVRDKRSNNESGRGHSSSIDDMVHAHFFVDLCFSFRGGLHFRVLPISMKQKESKTKKNKTECVYLQIDVPNSLPPPLSTSSPKCQQNVDELMEVDTESRFKWLSHHHHHQS